MTRRRGPYPEPIQAERRRAVAEHTHRQPRWPTIALAASVLALTVSVVVLTLFVVEFSAYVSGRGEYRDRETQRLEQEIGEAVCEVLDAVQAGGELDRVRADYGCGPGMNPPPEESPP